MKKLYVFLTVLIFLTAISGCRTGENTGPDPEPIPLFTRESYPRVDGSTVTLPLAISNAIKEEIMRQNLEEEVLYRPFSRIAENQPFALHGSMLEIVFPRGNPYFIGGREMNFLLPFSLFGDDLVILGRYRADQPLFEQAAFRKFMLPGPARTRRKTIETQGPGYEVNVYYIELENLPNPGLQERLNRQIAAEAKAFAEDQDFARQALEAYNRNSANFSRKERHVYRSDNFADILCIVQNDSIYLSGTGKYQYARRTYLFDTRTGRPLELKDLFREGVDYIALINRHIADEIALRHPENRPPFSTITAATWFYLQGQHLYILLEEDETQAVQSFWIPFEAFGENVLIFR